jgi:hypothetical protein
MSNPKISLSYENRILTVAFQDGAVISKNDLIEIYDFAYKSSKTQKYCIIFYSLGHYIVQPETLQYMINNPSNSQVLAKAYVLDSDEAIMKTIKHLEKDKPQLIPKTFKSLEAARKKMFEILVNSMV